VGVITLQGLLIGLDAGEGSRQFLNLGRHVGNGLLYRRWWLGVRAGHGGEQGVGMGGNE
jgi:hypothetical protein